MVEQNACEQPGTTCHAKHTSKRADLIVTFDMIVILLKNPKNPSTRLSMNGKSPKILTAPPFVLRFSKDERWVFQQNRLLCLTQLIFHVYVFSLTYRICARY